MSDRVAILYEDSGFKVVGENEKETLFLHCYVNTFSPSVLKRMKEVFEEIKDVCYLNGWDRVFSYTPNPKFAKILGGEKISEFSALGEDYEVFVWELKQV